MTELVRELKEEVVARRKQLELACRMAEHEYPAERRRSLEIALRLADSAVQEGWDRVSELGAAFLEHWLRETKPMVTR